MHRVLELPFENSVRFTYILPKVMVQVGSNSSFPNPEYLLSTYYLLFTFYKLELSTSIIDQFEKIIQLQT